MSILWKSQSHKNKWKVSLKADVKDLEDKCLEKKKNPNGEKCVEQIKN